MGEKYGGREGWETEGEVEREGTTQAVDQGEEKNITSGDRRELCGGKRRW